MFSMAARSNPWALSASLQPYTKRGSIAAAILLERIRELHAVLNLNSKPFHPKYTLYCTSDVSGHVPSCRCPYNEIAALRKCSDSLLPVSTPHMAISTELNNVVAETDDSKISVIIASQQLLESTHLNTQIPCSVHASRLEGCYSCQQGSRVNVSCYSAIPSWTTVVCAHRISSIEAVPLTTRRQWESRSIRHWSIQGATQYVVESTPL